MTAITRNQAQIPSKSNRHLMIWGLLLVFVGSLVWRLFDLHLVSDDFLQSQGDKRTVRTLPISAYRGMILDRNGEPLAVSSPVPSVWVNAKKLDKQSQKLPSLVKLLDLNHDVLNKLDHTNKTFVYLKRHISPQIAKQVDALGIDGVHIQTEYRRFYPTAEVTAHIVGSTNIDHQGKEGLELALNDVLSGKKGKKTVLKNRLGQQIESLGGYQSAADGKDVFLSIDSRLQYLAYRELLHAVKANHAKAGSIVVLDAKTFEVLAMANAPSYNPNMKGIGYNGALRNRAVTDQFEPGSVIKPISMAHILASGRYYPHTPIDTSPGWVKVGNKTVRDIRNYGQIDLSTVLKKSSNVGITKLLLSLPPQNLFDTLTKVGFGESTGSGFPGEVGGLIQHAGYQNPFALATLGFGYGISVTPLQLAQAYAVIASGGIKKKVSFVKTNAGNESERVMDSTIAAAVTDMLVRTTQADGTAYRAQVPGYTVAGKTGTVRKLGPHGYSEDSHLALFAGFAPAENPQVVIAVVIDEPSSGHYYGGQVAAPVFSKVMAGALRLRDVSPWGAAEEYLLVKK